MKIRKLDWDTNHFGFTIGAIDINKFSDTDFKEINRIGKEQGYDLVYVFSSMYQDGLPKPANTKILYQAQLADLREVQSDNIEILQDTHFNEVYDLALVAGGNSRFKLDTNFRVEDFESLYKKWVEKSFQDFHTVFGYVENGKVLGMISLKLIPLQSIANLELIGVNPDAQGKQIGTKLITACVNYIKENSNIQYFSVYTQEENILGCKFYEKCGFKKQNFIHIHHVWIK